MRSIPTVLDGLVVVEPVVHHDSRGFFLETFRKDAFAEVGIPVDFVQENHSRSTAGTLRGLHFQSSPGQPKLIRTARGRIFDVAVDIRPSSPTFGRHETFILDDENHRALYVPAGFAHGFLVLSETADVVYKVGTYYDSATERGIAWNDPDLRIQWPHLNPKLSLRDTGNPRLVDADPPDL